MFHKERAQDDYRQSLKTDTYGTLLVLAVQQLAGNVLAILVYRTGDKLLSESNGKVSKWYEHRIMERKVPTNAKDVVQKFLMKFVGVVQDCNENE